MGIEISFEDLPDDIRKALENNDYNIININDSDKKIFAQNIKHLIRNGKIEKAINEFSKEVEELDDIDNPLIILQNQYNSLKKEKIIGNISNDEYNRRLAQITFGLLSLIEEYLKSK
jgi:hypothetical protein